MTTLRAFLRTATISAMFVLVGCSTSPTAPTVPPLVITTPPITGIPSPPASTTIQDGRFVGRVTDHVTAELTIDRVRGHKFQVITDQNIICLDAGTSITNQIVFTAQAGTLGCYTRDEGRNNREYLKFCVTSADRVEGTFWMHPIVDYWADQCINGPGPVPASVQAPAGGSFGFTLTRQ